MGRPGSERPARIPANEDLLEVFQAIFAQTLTGRSVGRISIYPMKKNQQWCMSATLSLAVRPVSAAVALSLLPAVSALAANLDEVVVSATRYEQKLGEVLADVTIIDRDAIERSGAASIEDVLAKVPSIQITRTGGAGSTTELFLRGANKEHTAVYIDGIRMDAQNGSGGAQWESIAIDSIERIEIMRGAAGAVYGSDAMAGAIQIFTQRGEGQFKPYVSVGAGTHSTEKVTAGFSGAKGVWDYALGLSYAESSGFDSQPAGVNNDKDSYLRKSANARLGLKLSESQRLDVTAMTSDSKAGYDNRADKEDWAIRNLDAYGLQWENRWSEGFKTHVAVSESRTVYETIAKSPFLAKTELRNYVVNNELRTDVGLITLSAERREDSLHNSGLQGNERSRQQNALGIGYAGSWQAHSVQMNLRHDRDSDFGGKNTATAAYGWAFAKNWKATASAGTGFRVPTLIQRFGSNGDVSLKPEESFNTEVGVRWSEDGRNFSATAYRNKVENLVVYKSGQGSCMATGCYLNVDEAQLEGITFAGNWRTGAVSWYASADFQNPRNTQTGHLLQRRSQRYATLGGDTKLAGWSLGAEVQAASRRFDKEGGEKNLAGYALWNLSASRQLNKDILLTARVDNVFDRDYALARGYATAGRTVWVGVKWMPQ